MLSNLIIENIAVIESADIAFTRGFNCMTGETGAGKSVIIGSLSAILGAKTPRDLIRTGADRAGVQAYFEDISDAVTASLGDAGIDCPDRTLTLSRVMYRDGRNTCRANGAPVTVSALKAIAPLLINIHGQSDSSRLMDPEYHLGVIDAVAGDGEQVRDYEECFSRLISVRRQVKNLTASEKDKSERADLLKYQIDELENAGITPGETERLRQRRKVIENSRELSGSLSKALEALKGAGGAVEILFDAAGRLKSAAGIDSELASLNEKLNDIAYNADDAAREVRSYLSSVDFSESELSEINARLAELYELSAKYGSTEEAMLEYLDKASKELDAINDSDTELQRLKTEYDALLRTCAEKAYALSDIRQAAADRFCRKIKEELAFLNMKDTVFTAEFTRTALRRTGCDACEFMISANRGQSAKPLAKTASGGELSRIMLAIKCALAERDSVETLIFDEIDSGVSGRAAGQIAKKLGEVARTRQVICITHLPSIAAFADNHLKIEKFTRENGTFTEVSCLDESGRVNEIARIIGGDENEKIHLESAKRLIEEAEEYKKSFEC